ncbi:HNH endonuclease signature motif containing protein [Azospirillum tabaci]|uniref:HNH endonuclease signature motif containing protein n=1 Tax=Azospirillum tabaci TaxID=2752310 RepID=UPI0016604514|nr:HNH endonuclease signature motif containing protein [Azospirillum tabaci]
MGRRLSCLPPRVAKLDVSVAALPPKEADRFYLSIEWRKLVASLIRTRGRRCERCGKTHEDDGGSVKLIGDHKVERKDGGAELDPANIELLCARAGGNGRPRADGGRGGCHAAKTAQARAQRMATVYRPGPRG